MNPRPLMRGIFMGRRLVTLAGIVLFVLLLYFIFVPRPVAVEMARAEIGEFKEVIKSEARLRSKDQRLITAFANGRLGRVALRAGDPIKKGQKITTLYWDYDSPVVSPIDGVISKVYREAAGPISRAEPIVEVVDPDDLEIVAELLTPDAARAEVGDPMQVEISEDLPPLAAKVVRISKAGFTKRSALGVEEERTEVIGEPLSENAAELKRLGHNYHVEVTIELASYRHVLTVPIGAIFRDNDGWAVFRVLAGRARKTKIKIAHQGNTQAMVAEGLQAGDWVVMYPGDLVRDGARVRPLRK